MTLSRRAVVVAAASTSLLAFASAASAALKPKATSNRVPKGAPILGPRDPSPSGSRTAAAAGPRLGVALYDQRALIFSQEAGGKEIARVDVALGGGYAVSQSVMVFLQAKGATHRLVLTAGGGKAVHAVDVDPKSGRMKQIPAAGPDTLKSLGISAKDLQGEIALKPGGTNVWEIEP